MTLKLQFVVEAIDNATAKVREVNRAVEKSREPWLKVRASAREFFNEAGWTKLQRQMDVVRERGAAITTWGRNASAAMLGLGAAAATGLFGIQRLADGVDRINDTAQGLGVSAQRLQEVGYAAKMNGSSFEEVAQSLVFMNKNMAEARQGNKEMVLWMARAGISAADLKNKNFTAVDAFERMSDTFASVGDKGDNSQKKIAHTTQLLGRQGIKMIQLMNGGGAALRGFYAEANRVGAVLSDKTIKAMGDFNDSMDKTKLTLFGAIATALGPAANMLGGIAERVVEWTVANRALIATRVEEFIKRVEQGLPAFVAGVVQVADAIGEVASVANSAANAVGGWGNAMLVIAGLFAGKFLLDLLLFGVAVAELIAKFAVLSKFVGLIAAGFAAATLPVWLLVGALVAGAALVMAYWEPISKFFSDLWTKVEGLSGAGARFFGLGSTSPVSSAGGPAGSAIPSGGMNRVGGELKIAITGAPARVESLRKSNGSLLDLSVDTGKAMAGAY